MATVEEVMDSIIDKANEYLATQPTNKYLHGFDVGYVLEGDPETFVENFNKGDAGKIAFITTDSGITYFSWAPTQHDLDHRENLR